MSGRWVWWTWCAFFVVVGAVACSPVSDDSAPSVEQTPPSVEQSSPSTATATDETSASMPDPQPTSPVEEDDLSNCAVPPGQGPEIPFARDAVGPARTILDRDGITVDAAVYPLPDYEGRPWSQWGQGIVAADGSFLSGVGDHRGPDGNSFIYRYDPDARELIRIADVLSLVEHAAGSWGYGKIHAQMVPGPCGDVYVTTYWGTMRDLEFSGSYRGDHLLRIDPESQTVQSMGVLEDEHGVPSLAAWPGGGLIYAEAADPSREGKAGFLVVYDALAGEVVERLPVDGGFRAMAVDARGRVFVTSSPGSIDVWDPATGELEPAGDLPGGFLRGAASPRADGSVIAVTEGGREFFRIDSDGDLVRLGEARGYTTSLAHDPDRDVVYYVPGAHGDAWEDGAAVWELDPDSGEQRVVVRLNEAAERELGLRLGGSYNVVFDPARRRLYVGMNAAPPTNDSTFGQVVLLSISLP